MLIRSAELLGRGVFDLRIEAGRIAQIGERLPLRDDEVCIEAEGGVLLPGLHDHHLHLRAFAAARDSVCCGPPEIRNAVELQAALAQAAAQRDPQAWIRGVAYHDVVAGPLDRHWLDAHGPACPLRIQHRSGRLWIFNSQALRALGVNEADTGSDPFERIDGQPSGRLYDADDWVRARLGREPPSLGAISRWLAAAGVTGVTDTTPDNGPEALASFVQAQARGELLQDLRVMGDERLDASLGTARAQRGATKFHLHEHELPDFDALCAAIRRSHAAGRECAFHCVTRTELGFALGALREAGAGRGDRIEHAAVVAPEWVEELHALGVVVVTQPHFIAERGDEYLHDVAPEDQPWLYRLRGLAEAGVPLAFGSDAPFGAATPWASMQAAVERRSPRGIVMGANEALSPEQALAGWLTPLENPGSPPRQLRPGSPADLCLLYRPWSEVRRELAAPGLRMTLRAGEILWDHSAPTPVVSRTLP